VIGVESDSASLFYGIKAARQLRVGYKHQDSYWNESDGTFMIFTVDLSDGKSSASNCLGTYGLSSELRTQAYAQYSTASHSWVVQSNSSASNCPSIFQDMQAPSLVHLGSAKYKLYFGTPSVEVGKSLCSVPWLGPKRMLYADGRTTGATGKIEYNDWEGKANQREMRFAWPDGSILSDRAEGYIDDFEFLAVPGNLSSQHAYLTIADGSDSCSLPLITYATLVNP
jgi:hypothetical protein